MVRYGTRTTSQGKEQAMKAEISLDEAMNLADRYRRTVDGQYAEAFGVLCDYIIVTNQRLKEATKRVKEAEEKVQALSLDLGMKENRVRPTLIHGGKEQDSGGKEGGTGTTAQDASVNVSGVGGTGGVF